LDAGFRAKRLDEFFVFATENYTGYAIYQKRWDGTLMMRGTVPALLGNGISWGARALGFQGNIIRTKKVGLSVF